MEVSGRAVQGEKTQSEQCGVPKVVPGVSRRDEGPASPTKHRRGSSQGRGRGQGVPGPERLSTCDSAHVLLPRSAHRLASAALSLSLLLPQVTFTDIGLTARDNEGATALHFAARGGHTPILDRLLLMGAPIMRDSWGGTPLHDAAENGQTEVRQLGGVLTELVT